MKFHSAAYLLYLFARRAIRAVGLTKAARGVLGPIVGRLILRLASGSNRLFIVHGHRMVLASGEGYPPLNMVMGRYEEETTRLLQSLVKPGMVFVDVGAHLGYYTLLAARGVGPTGKIYSFEPDPDNHALLLRNVELNAYDNVVAARKAVSDRVGTGTLYLTALDSGRHSMYHHGLPERGRVAVETTTMDFYLGSEGWPRVDLVKIDVEGAEVSVLEGMAQLLEKSDDLKLIIEFNPSLLQNAGVLPLEFLEKPASLGFKVYLIDEEHGLSSLAADDAPALVNRLMAAQDSVNLFCKRQ